LDKIIPNDSHLWTYFKKLQTTSQNRLLLILDQFEEVFTYPEKQIQQFAQQFADVLYSDIPQYMRDAVQKSIAQNSFDLSDIEKTLLGKSIDVKVLFAIRSDRMSFLDRLTIYLPDILRKRFELKALSPEQAEDAIIFPAAYSKPDIQFRTPKFDYSDKALKKIMSFLTRNYTENIEGFQLQIICQYCESLVDVKTQNFASLPEIQPDDLGDIDEIYKNYYNNLIARLPENEQLAAKIFIEEGLIFEEDQRRLSLYEGQIYRQFNISKELLSRLVDTHIIRAEPHSSGGFTYELSHDTLVAPVLAAKRVRKEVEELEKAEREKAEKEQAEREQAEKEKAEREKKLKQQRLIITIVSIAAVISIGLAIFGIVMWKRASTAQQKALIEMQKTEKMYNDLQMKQYDLFITEGDKYFAEHQFENAIKQYSNAKEIRPDNSKELDSIINQCKNIAIKEVEYKKLCKEGEAIMKIAEIQFADSYYPEAADNFLQAYSLFKKAVLTNFPDNFANEKLSVLKAKMKELSAKMSEIARKLKGDEAKSYLNKANLLINNL